MNKEMKKKKFNKKLLMFGLPLLCLALVSAGLLIHYGQIKQNFDIEQAVVLSCPGDDCVEESLSEISGNPLLSEVYFIKNIANTTRNVELVTSCFVNGSSCEEGEVITNYVGVLELTTKDGTWDGTDDRKAIVEYSIVGDVFTYTIIEGEGDLNISDYKLIYYRDDPSSTNDEDRMATLGTVYVIDNGENIGSLPMTNDWNAQELANYCNWANTFDDYKHCKGAKLWLVPSANAVDGLIDWTNWNLFLYETDLIVYSTDDIITLPAGGGFNFMVENTFVGTGDYTITTQVQPVTA